jgi:hypothetical protein
MLQGRADALIVSDQAENLTYRQLVVELAAKSGLPAIYPYREQVEVGGLMAYAPDLLDLYRRAAGYERDPNLFGVQVCADHQRESCKSTDYPAFAARPRR